MKADGWRKLAAAVLYSYGHRYQRAADYLVGLANNQFWRDEQLSDFEWLANRPSPPSPGVPRYVMHDALINALAPSVPLRVVWQGNRWQ